MDVTLDIAALVSTILWPLVILVLFLRFREPLSELARELPRRVRSISAAGVSIELAAAEARPLLTAPDVQVDLRHAGTPADLNDSTLRSFYAQIENPARMEHAVVDLGEGSEWLSSRLYILSVILRRMRGLQAFVFVRSVGTSDRRLLGIGDAEQVRWRLAARWPRYESALAAAELQVWGHPYDEQVGIIVPGRQAPDGGVLEIPAFRDWAVIVDADGRMVTPDWPSPEPAVDLLRAFLDAVQRPAVVPAVPPSPAWQELPATPGVVEYAEWLSGPLVDDVVRDSLDRRSVRLRDWQGWAEDIRVRAVVEHEGRWLAVTRDDGVFDRLLDRTQLLEQLGRQATAPPR